MNIFKKIWYRYWRAHLHWHNSKGQTLITSTWMENTPHFVCSLCNQAVVLDLQRNWILKWDIQINEDIRLKGKYINSFL